MKTPRPPRNPWYRSAAAKILEMTRVLPAAGFRSADEAPPAPVERHEEPGRKPHDDPRPHEEHVEAAHHMERGHPKR